jgi:hypothetical protein
MNGKKAFARAKMPMRFVFNSKFTAFISMVSGLATSYLFWIPAFRKTQSMSGDTLITLLVY